jgi:hypothetical protein
MTYKAKRYLRHLAACLLIWLVTSPSRLAFALREHAGAAGDVTTIYGTTTALTQTSLDGVASSSTFLSGWTSDAIDNTSIKAQDYLITGNFQAESAGLAAGQIRVYVYASYNGTNWPDLFSAGTEGAEGTATIHDANILAGHMILLWATDTDTTASQNYPMPPRSVAAAFGGVVPKKFAIYVAQSTGAALETTGDPNRVEYTAISYNVAQA